MCFFGVSLRTSTYFWTFMHVFLAVVFLLVCGLETFKFGRDENEQGFLVYISSPIVVKKSDLYMLWSYGFVYFTCGLMIFHGVHKELPCLIRWVLFLYVIIEFCAAYLLKLIIKRNAAVITSRTEDLPDTFVNLFQTSLVVFFITVHIVVSFFYSLMLLIYSYVLHKSKLIVQNIVYV